MRDEIRNTNIEIRNGSTGSPQANSNVQSPNPIKVPKEKDSNGVKFKTLDVDGLENFGIINHGFHGLHGEFLASLLNFKKPSTDGRAAKLITQTDRF